MELDRINAVFNGILTIGTGVAVLACAVCIMWGGFIWMTSVGSPRQVEAGRTAVVNALVGFALIGLANVIARLMQSAIGGAA